MTYPPLDCLIIGSGPAGLTAAIYLARFRRHLLVVDKGWSRAKWITHSHNMPGFAEGVAGQALLATMQAQARLYGAVVEAGTTTALHRDVMGNLIAHENCRDVVATTVILATGVIENKPPVAGVAEAVKRGLVRTSPICDGYESIGKDFAVLGSGEHAAREAIFLRTYTARVSLLLMSAETAALSDAILEDLLAAGISLIHVVIGSIRLNDKVAIIGVEDGVTHQFNLIYSTFGTIPQTALAAAIGAKLDGDQRVFVNEHQGTSVAGMFAAGDLVRGLNQISVANGEGEIAATAIHNRLRRVFA